MILDNRDQFRTYETERWAIASGLKPAEVNLFERFLKPELSVMEAGTGGGRILLALSRMGFCSLFGFDYVSELINQARRRQGAEHIDFRVMDAVHLTYLPASFDQVLYLEQVLSSIESETARQCAVKEAYRVLKPGGIALFSVLLIEARTSHLLYRLFLNYLKLIRMLSGEQRTVQYQPWLRRGGRPNFSAFADRPPYIYWATVGDALALFRNAGFTIEYMGTTSQLKAGIIGPPDADLTPIRPDDALFLICRK